MEKSVSYSKQYYRNLSDRICYCVRNHIPLNIREIVVDNFAGGGGASTGIELAIGRSVDIAINHDPGAIRMHMVNHPDTKHYCESVWDVDPLEVCGGRPVGLAWFSPDCKHFSKAKGGKPVEKHIRGLAWIVLKWAALVRPRVIMLENVEEFQTWGPCIPVRDKDTGRVLVDLSEEYSQKKSASRTRIAEPGEIVPADKQLFMPDPQRKGETYQRWRRQLEALGYHVETKELVAADYGAPTTRKRFFMIARCDGLPVVWPKATHGPRNSSDVQNGKLKPYVSASEIIDWSIPCPSIFDRKKPLAPNTMKRIAKGLQKFVMENPEPFIVQVNHTGEQFRGQSIQDPMPTLTSKHGFGVVTPYIVQLGQTGFTQERNKPVTEPITTVVSKAEHCLVEPVLTPFIEKSYGGNYSGPGSSMEEPLHTITSVDHNHLVVPILAPYIMCNNNNNVGRNIEDPVPTITTGNRNFLIEPKLHAVSSDTKSEKISKFIQEYLPSDQTSASQTSDETPDSMCAAYIIQQQGMSIGTDARDPLNTMTGVNHMGEVVAFLVKYYGNSYGQDVREPLDTVTSKERFGLIEIRGVQYQIVDIGLRMLEPFELYGAQGFPDDYVIDRDIKGKVITKTEQVKRCGNAVCPPIPAALVKENLPELCRCIRLPICRNDRLTEETTGQLRFA